MTDMSFKLPSIKPAVQDLDDDKMSSLETKLKHIENELHRHHVVVNEIENVVEQFVEKSYEQHGEDNEPMLSMYDSINFDDKDGGVWKQGWVVDYKEDQWNYKNKLKVFIVPHSHNDPGWIKTFENYYKTQTKAIFTNLVEKLGEGRDRKFIWAEICYLSMWWNLDASAGDKATFQKYLNSGQVEIVTGGWVMNDEANSHWLSIIQQLTAGHQWLIDTLDYIPKNAWAIDPFGYSSTQPYLLKLAGLENSIIQRVHYRIKKELALNQQLEFHWRQLWDGTGNTDMFTHMMPFYSYDIPHSCGPDPKICCQFDFKRLPGNGVSCPWGEPPKKITSKNVEERAFTILDQWRKKAQLYRSNVLMFPLGDDFRYDRANEWDNQFQNYDRIIDFINSNDAWNAEVRFGTLQDYFKALHAEMRSSDFPVLSGDFFTYADRNQHYWSGYYTSRPFYKNMDRVLLAYVRAAETITCQATTSGEVSQLLSLQLFDRVNEARRALALFQHHDGITGTSRDEVRADYAKKIIQCRGVQRDSDRECKAKRNVLISALFRLVAHQRDAIQQAAFYMLGQPHIPNQTHEDIFFDVDDIWRQHDEIPTRITIALDVMSPSRRIIFYNSLMFRRHEIMTLVVSTPYVEVFDQEGKPVVSQVSPIVAGEKRLNLASNKYQLSFMVEVDPLTLATYSVIQRDNMSNNQYTKYAKVRVFNADYWNIDLPNVFDVEQARVKLEDDLSVQAGGTKFTTNMNGMLKAIVSVDGTVTPVHMDYVQYDTMRARDNNSGAYLFIPSGPAKLFKPEPYPEIVVIEGPHKGIIYSTLSGTGAEIVLTMSMYNNPTLPQTEIEITNTFLIEPQIDDLELAMRFSTGIKNGNDFYTDLNGMQMIKRRYYEKLPLQANFYPFMAAAYLQDENMRLTLLTSTPLGMAALQPGQIEVMQDRRLSRDDNRGLNQGVLDNIRTRHIFKLIIEKANVPCSQKTPPEHPSGQLSIGAHVSQLSLLQPLVVMHHTTQEGTPLTPPRAAPPSPGVDVLLAAYSSHIIGKNKDGTHIRGLGMTFHRTYLDVCYGNQNVTKWYPLGDGQVNLKRLLQLPSDIKLYNSTLTFVRVEEPLSSDVVTLCPMEVRSFFANYTQHY
ncbi:Alpha-mannosidase 2 [Eumeta japonica]|uniref:Alpha-mannosidase n=1 Tax=Eumeta variegata TaxID=151549 RepID=A0A4C1VAX2_EUMVA|nr:Alpha-mannosidase 2 [Eumeta japonica]